jgi:dipeptidase E
MKLYLSSFKLGNELTRLKELISQTSGIFGYVPNSLDFVGAEPQRRTDSIQKDIVDLESQSVKVEILDLKDYFGKKAELKGKLESLGGLYVRGGNTFVLRQAMKLSGLDELLLEMRDRSDFLYIAYSAGVCVLTPTLKPYAITDDANNFPYDEIREQVWDGLNIVPFVFQPHYKSDHPESASTDQEIEYCIENKILFQAFRDGEVLIVE